MSEPITLTNFDPTKFLVVPECRFSDLKNGDKGTITAAVTIYNRHN